MHKFKLVLNLQLFAEADADDEDVEDIEGEDIEGEVITNEDVHLDGGGNHSRAHRMGLSEEVEASYWKQFLELQKMQNEKVDAHLVNLTKKLEDLDSRHQAIPAGIKEELNALFVAHQEAGNIAQDAEDGKKLSKYSARHTKS